MSAYDLWRDILGTNSENTAEALGAYIQKLEHLRENLRARAMQLEFDRAHTVANKLRS